MKSLYLVDLPGYGYARGGRRPQEGFRTLLESYFGGSTRLAAVLHLVDARHPGLPQDVAAWDWIRALTTRAPRTDTPGTPPTHHSQPPSSQRKSTSSPAPIDGAPSKHGPDN